MATEHLKKSLAKDAPSNLNVQKRNPGKMPNLNRAVLNQPWHDNQDAVIKRLPVSLDSYSTIPAAPPVR